MPKASLSLDIGDLFITEAVLPRLRKSTTGEMITDINEFLIAINKTWLPFPKNTLKDILNGTEWVTKNNSNNVYTTALLLTPAAVKLVIDQINAHIQAVWDKKINF